MNRRWRVRLTVRAEKDLEDIAIWTADHFGTLQARRYMKTLTLALESLAAGPDARGTKVRDDLAPGVRSLHAARNGRRASHLVVFRGTEDVIEVLRVLHDSMEPRRHITEIED